MFWKRKKSTAEKRRLRREIHFKNGETISVSNYRCQTPMAASWLWFIEADEGRFVVERSEVAWFKDTPTPA